MFLVKILAKPPDFLFCYLNETLQLLRLGLKQKAAKNVGFILLSSFLHCFLPLLDYAFTGSAFDFVMAGLYGAWMI
jgi:hypothetical protein